MKNFSGTPPSSTMTINLAQIVKNVNQPLLKPIKKLLHHQTINYGISTIEMPISNKSTILFDKWIRELIETDFRAATLILEIKNVLDEESINHFVLLENRQGTSDYDDPLIFILQELDNLKSHFEQFKEKKNSNTSKNKLYKWILKFIGTGIVWKIFSKSIRIYELIAGESGNGPKD
ncbi:hypothetical protein ABN763_06350 [Spongiivirga sp. MCCC 1A20706]|uniref:hypothetical protein n=1 Tax=Spongiivirga sp. MCCC 1A20706 TaxID=3160963 RepID=UPI0039776D5E